MERWMGGEERKARTLALFIHIFLGSDQETPTQDSSASPPAALLTHQASVLLHFPRLRVGRGQADPDPTPTVVLKLACTFESPGSYCLGPAPEQLN